jgi:hypothetical protein
LRFLEKESKNADGLGRKNKDPGMVAYICNPTPRRLRREDYELQAGRGCVASKTKQMNETKKERKKEGRKEGGRKEGREVHLSKP